MSDYTSKRFRKLRTQFRDDCRRSRARCVICGSPIDYSLKYPNQWAWELHHIKPSSTHPHLHYQRTNWASSHSRCNKSMGNKAAPDPNAWVAPAW
jgi:5-methylcytosine-specific restriction endonuclease McrA